MLHHSTPSSLTPWRGQDQDKWRHPCCTKLHLGDYQSVSYQHWPALIAEKQVSKSQLTLEFVWVSGETFPSSNPDSAVHPTASCCWLLIFLTVFWGVRMVQAQLPSLTVGHTTHRNIPYPWNKMDRRVTAFPLFSPVTSSKRSSPLGTDWQVLPKQTRKYCLLAGISNPNPPLSLLKILSRPSSILLVRERKKGELSPQILHYP